MPTPRAIAHRRLQLRGLGDTPACLAPTTPGFQAWFNGSVVVDSAGCPLTVWHGHPTYTDAFAEFDFDRAIDIGVHFGTRKAAESFGTARPFYLALRRPVALTDPGDWLAPGLSGWGPVPVLDELVRRGHLDEAAYEHTLAEVERAKKPSSWQRQAAEWGIGRARASKIVRDLVESLGFDSIVYENRSEDVGSRSWIAFHPWQIKSVNAKRFARTPNIFDGLGRLGRR